MKYTKKVPYFKKGDKVDKVDEAFKKLPKEQKEAILKINSAQKEQERKDKLSSVGAGFKRPTAEVITPVDTRSKQIKSTVGKKAARTRGEAFQQARARGDSEFLWQGKRYHTRTAEEEAKRNVNEVKTSARTDVPGQSFGSRRVSLGSSPKTRIGIIPKYMNDSPYELSTYFGFMPRIPSNYVFPTFPEITEPEPEVVPEAELVSEAEEEAERKAGTDTYEQNFVPRKVSLGNSFKSNIGIIPKYTDNSPFFTTKSFLKSGGTINKFQRGTQGSGITRADLPKTSKWNIFGFQPNSAKWFPTDRDLPKGQTEEVSRYMHRNKDITTLRRPRPYYTADQPSMYNSTRTINWDNNTPVDTTYTYGNKVIQPNTIDHERYKAAFAGGDRALLQNIGKHQQGGAIQQQGVDKEALVADFVVRYLKTMGVPEEAIVTPEGSVNPEYEQELTTVITEIDSPEFWEAYQNSPDEVVAQVVRARNPNAVTIARKGAKLKRLSQLRIYKK